ncbi:hypothetical protein ACFWRG_07080, partial [Micromonospora tulbaghiae]|uniref:hypothetical protein n=1 Tax=Micromonospora tulbaghiae TaxID=479978 RepID=UPI003669F414
MSNYLRNNNDATSKTISPLRRRRMWLATGVVGLTGAVSLAGVAYATTGATGPHRLADVKWSTTQQLSDGDHGDKGEYGRDGYDKDGHDKGKDGKDRGQEGRDRGEWGPEKGDWDKDGKDDHGKTREVACDDDALVDALELANRDHGGTLKLAENCTYELGVKDRKFGSALPEIKQDVTIKGNNSTIKRDAEDTFRIFRVVDGGDLTLKDLTVKGGNANEFKYPGGGAPGGGQSPAAAPAAAPAVAAPAAAPAVAAPAAATTAAATTAAAAAPVADGGKDDGKDDDKRFEGDGGALLVERGGSAHLHNVKLTHNNAEGDGGAIANYGRTWLKESKVVDNHAQGDGGGVYNEGILKVEETHVDDNTAGGNGGGIANGSGLSGGHGPAASAAPKGYDKKEKHHDAGTVEIFGSDHGKDGVKSSLSDNRAGKNGGGLFSSGGTVTVSFTAITGNTACENGGGVYAENTDLLLEKVHVAKNHADGDGGGVVVTGGKHWGYPNDKERASATIADSKIVDNTANRFGGGIYNGEWLIKIEDGFLARDHDKDDNATLTIRDTDIKG